MPVMAYRHCEPLRMASAYGWYIFPPEDIVLRFNGTDVHYVQDGEWLPLSQTRLPRAAEHWDAHAPADLQGLVPPFLTHLPMKGFVQIWSGLLCSTREGWSTLIRPLVNLRSSHSYACFEGLVESDRFQPFPLFVNIQLLATDALIEIPRNAPLFQVQPLLRATYSDAAHRLAEHALDSPGAPMDWAGYRRTIRVDQPDAAPEKGQYTVATRRRTRQEGA